MYTLVKCQLRTNSIGLTVSVISNPADQSYMERISVWFIVTSKEKPSAEKFGMLL